MNFAMTKTVYTLAPGATLASSPVPVIQWKLTYRQMKNLFYFKAEKGKEEPRYELPPLPAGHM